MKTSTNLLLASAVVVVLMVSALGGVTYSWFSDSETFDVEIGTAKVNLDYELYNDDILVTDNTVTIEEGTNDLELIIENNSTVPVAFEASFTVPRYSAYSDSSFKTYVGELKPNDDGTTYSLDSNFKDLWSTGHMGNSIKSISVSFNKEAEQKLGHQSGDELTGDNSSLGSTEIENTTYYVLYIEYSTEYTSTLLPGTKVSIPIEVNVGDQYTEGSMLNPFIEATAIQANASGETKVVEMTPDGNNSLGEFDCSSLTDVTKLVFQDGDTAISFDWQALSTQNLSKISVSLTKSNESLSVSIQATGSNSESITLDGRVQYTLSVGSNGISSVTSDETPVSCLVSNNNGSTTVSFTDSASNTTHTVGLVTQS